MPETPLKWWKPHSVLSCCRGSQVKLPVFSTGSPCRCSGVFVLSTPTETDGAVFPGRIMLANTCTWTYRGDECGYHGPAVADEYDQPTSDITKDKCSKCLSGCKFRNNVGNFGGFLSINKLSQ